MSLKSFSSITSFLIFSILVSFTTATYSPANLLIHRQQQVAQSVCNDYSTVANLSVVGSNATYRSAYLQASPEGTNPARQPLDDAITELPSFQFDTEINAECGNLTEVAIEGAATNFTQGVVLQFNMNSAVQIGASAMGVVMITVMVVFMVNDVL